MICVLARHHKTHTTSIGHRHLFTPTIRDHHHRHLRRTSSVSKLGRRHRHHLFTPLPSTPYQLLHPNTKPSPPPPIRSRDRKKRGGGSFSVRFQQWFWLEAEEGEDDEDIAQLFQKGKKKKKSERSAAEVAMLVERVMADLGNPNTNHHSSSSYIAQREKILDKQLHSLIEQLEGKQVQAEGLVSEIHLRETELERLNGLARKPKNSNLDVNTARNRLGRSNSERGSTSSDCIIDAHHKPPFYIGGRTQSQQRLMLLRSAFVLYISALHILVFIKISF